MLPEPDLFSSVNINNHNPGSYSQSVSSEDTDLLAANQAVKCGHPDKTIGQEVEVCESNRSYLTRCHPYTVGVATVISKRLSESSSSAGSKDPRERRVRQWYLTVIVLLYIGLITSFCLNVSLLLKSYPEPSSAEIRLSQHQLGLREAELSRGKYLSTLL
jgi:hypothetical protein